MKNFKKILAAALSVLMLAGLFSGCGEKEITITLLPEEADAYYAPNVILEPEKAPYNLGGWMEEDEVWWYLDIPATGTYTVRFLYSMPGEYEDNVGWLTFAPDDDFPIGTELTFSPTSEPGSWETYTWTEVTMDLPRGHMTLALSPYMIPEGQDYFINLRQIEITNGETGKESLADRKKNSIDQTEVTEEEPTEEVLSSAASGWYVRPLDYESEGISLLDYFYYDEDSGTCTSYNAAGSEVDTYACWTEAGDLIISMPFGDVTFLMEDGILSDPDSGNIEFIQVMEPEFEGGDVSFDGTWYRWGDVDCGDYYILSGNSYQRIMESGGESFVYGEGSMTRSVVDHQIADYLVRNVVQMEADDFGPTFYPAESDGVLYEEDFPEYSIYVREDTVNPDMVPAYHIMSDLMNMNLVTVIDDDFALGLNFHPLCFSISSYHVSSDGLLTPGSSPVYGTWALSDTESVALTYEDGHVDYVTLPEPGGSFYVPSVDCEFHCEEVF